MKFGHICEWFTLVVEGCFIMCIMSSSMFLMWFFIVFPRSLVKLESLEDTYLLEGGDDSLSDKHGCPAYVSPEILNANGSYSGKAADVWSLGVMLYTILVGRYPFHDVEPSSLFSKIRRGQFSIPETLTPKARCLIRSILRREPAERLTSREILDHPWFSASVGPAATANHGRGERELDQMVPEANMEEELEQFFSWAQARQTLCHVLLDYQKKEIHSLQWCLSLFLIPWRDLVGSG